MNIYRCACVEMIGVLKIDKKTVLAGNKVCKLVCTWLQHSLDDIGLKWHSTVILLRLIETVAE